jgi:hypothetical protein
MRTAIYSIGPFFIEGISPLIQGPLWNMCRIFENHSLTWIFYVKRCQKRPPFMDTLSHRNDVDGALQMTESFLRFPTLSGMDGIGWSRTYTIMDLLNLYSPEFIAHCEYDGHFS